MWWKKAAPVFTLCRARFVSGGIISFQPFKVKRNVLQYQFKFARKRRMPSFATLYPGRNEAARS